VVLSPKRQRDKRMRVCTPASELIRLIRHAEQRRYDPGPALQTAEVYDPGGRMLQRYTVRKSMRLPSVGCDGGTGTDLLHRYIRKFPKPLPLRVLPLLPLCCRRAVS
jgi:hypothetical protein